MVVYVLQECWYSSQEVYGVFSTYEKATDHALELKLDSARYEVTEHILDDE